MYDVCDTGALPDVFRCNRTVPDGKGGSRLYESKSRLCGICLNLLDMPEFNHQVELTTGVMEEECSQMMKSFFKELEARKKKKHWKKSRQRKYKRQVTR